MPLLASFAILTDPHHRVLLCHRRDRDAWNLPGGGVEPGESPWECVVREVKEETGLEVQVERLAGLYHKPDADELVFSFVCTITGGTISVSDEADRLEYFPLDSLPSNTLPKQVERIHDAHNHPEQPVLKVQRDPHPRPF
jgi:ADP-ribose pyrophosphatase YjhB (NUDIX family)